MMVTAPPRPADYPAPWAVDALLPDGATVHIRPVRQEDARALVTHFSRLSEESVYFRFFSAKRELSDAEAAHFTTVDYSDRMAFVAFQGDELVGVGRYERIGISAIAEVAFAVVDAHQGRGIGTLLLECLSAYALEHGITRFCAEVLTGNTKMLDVFYAAGCGRKHDTADQGVVRCEFNIEPTALTRSWLRQIRRSHSSATDGPTRRLEPCVTMPSSTDRTDPASASRQ